MGFNEDILTELETSLRNYFIRIKERRPMSNAQNADLFKYRGLTLSINDNDQARICFKITILGFEAQFRVDDGQKVSGSLRGDEREVQRWYMTGDTKLKMMRATSTKRTKGDYIKGEEASFKMNQNAMGD